MYFEDLFHKCEQSDMIIVAGLARPIWLRRNDVVFGGSMSSPQVLLQLTLRAIDDFQLAQGLRETNLLDQVEQYLQTCWSAPLPGWVKANLDTSLDT